LKCSGNKPPFVFLFTCANVPDQTGAIWTILGQRNETSRTSCTAKKDTTKIGTDTRKWCWIRMHLPYRWRVCQSLACVMLGVSGTWTDTGVLFSPSAAVHNTRSSTIVRTTPTCDARVHRRGSRFFADKQIEYGPTMERSFSGTGRWRRCRRQNSTSEAFAQ
jgi:hypothetical protein